jgi:geranylgeranyl pyrophosphate synthase
MADACVKLVEGETMQAIAVKEGTLDRETYKRIIARKTASLFQAAAQMAAILAGADEAITAALGRYGYSLGLAFQIVDDVLDVVGDPALLGKPTGSDLRQGSGLAMAQNGRRQEVADPVLHDPIREMMATLRDSGAVELALAEAQGLARQAIRQLDVLPETTARNELVRLAEVVVSRES